MIIFFCIFFLRENMKEFNADVIGVFETPFMK